jgi:mono/diheme cytochrome c family protein
MLKTAITALMLFAIPCAAAWSADYVAMSGRDLYQRFCASCHGVDGRGTGPVASSFSIEVPDLTLLGRRHGGFFDRALVGRIIDGRHVIGAHGTRTMPVWGEDLSRAYAGDPNAEEAAQRVIEHLIDYVAQMQKPAAAPHQD